MKTPTNNTHFQRANSFYLQTALLAAVPDSLRRLLRAVHASGNLRDIAIVEVLAGTGLRVGEIGRAHV